MPEDVQQVRPQGGLAARDVEGQHAGRGQVVQHRPDLVQRQFALLTLDLVAVRARVVAPVGDLEVHPKRPGLAVAQAL